MTTNLNKSPEKYTAGELRQLAHELDKFADDNGVLSTIQLHKLAAEREADDKKARLAYDITKVLKKPHPTNTDKAHDLIRTFKIGASDGQT